MKLEIGRPANCVNRLEKEVKVYDLLDKLAIGYARIDHKSLSKSGEDFDLGKVLDVSVCKNVVLYDEQKELFYLLIMFEEKELKTKELCSQLKSPGITVANDTFVEEHLGLALEDLNIMGLMNDDENRVQLIVDREVLEAQYFGCSPCVDTASIKLRIEDLIGRFLPFIGHELTVVELSWL